MRRSLFTPLKLDLKLSPDNPNPSSNCGSLWYLGAARCLYFVLRKLFTANAAEAQRNGLLMSTYLQ